MKIYDTAKLQQPLAEPGVARGSHGHPIL